ncbi:ammonium transporter [Acetobacterium malicum]|uniref:Ammonium transporter n=1 Tax=Acetobacterium malicum TaxID=52692 RepID=A0ABR6YXL1_9FIRM|nr:ammonium transporter [Acetobacterium malicum]MBC3899875.1 ammonium transporter [Acetobacterium malicum]
MELLELTQYIDIVWVFLASVLVFFMQAGFAMVETGFTRAKNAGNIIMKNFVDFMIGSILFFCFGFAFMFGPDVGGFIGTAGFFNPENLTNVSAFEAVTPELFIFFQTVFCATAATIVSGAVAGRTKFSVYCLISAFVSLIIYPVVGHWAWGGGFLGTMGFIDFAGSTVVHSVGGWTALMGAVMVGPRIGKYNKDGKANAIPGHSLTLGALGVFILWFAWFGFNCGSTLAVNLDIGHIAMTTNLAAAAGGLTVMFLTWARYKKPDISMTLNGVLGGLVAITAGCLVVTIWGAIIIGIIAGVIITFGIPFIDQKLKIDDPVGAIGVHCMNGVAGTLLVGLFANYLPGTEDAILGLLYGGGIDLLIVQAIGVIAVAAWTLGTSFLLFYGLKKTVGLRVEKVVEIEGLDVHEHGIEAYSDFVSRMN